MSWRDYEPVEDIRDKEFRMAHGHDDRERELDRDYGEYHLPRGVRRPAHLLEQEDEAEAA